MRRRRSRHLLIDLVQAPTLLGEERAGQQVMRAAFKTWGSNPGTYRSTQSCSGRARALRPFSWSVDGKTNVVATWGPSRPDAGRSLILNGHIDVVSPGPH